MGFLSFLGGLASSALDSLASGASSLVNNTANIIGQSEINRLNRISQENMNAQNIQAQKDINSQNIQNQNYWNQMTMNREDNAWQRASQDIQKAGLSKALLSGGASATPLSTANAIAPQGQAFTDNKWATVSGDTATGLGLLGAGLVHGVKSVFGGKDGDSSVNTGDKQTTVEGANGPVTVSLVTGSDKNGHTSHFGTRDVMPKKFVASPITADSVGFSNVATTNTLKKSVAPTVQAGMAQASSDLSGSLKPESKQALIKYLKFTTVTADGNVSYDSKYGGSVAYLHEVPKLLEPVCADLITHGVVSNQAEAQIYVKDLAYTVHTETASHISDDTLKKMLGPGLFPNHYGAQRVGKSDSTYPHKVFTKYYVKGGANGAKYNSHD